MSSWQGSQDGGCVLTGGAGHMHTRKERRDELISNEVEGWWGPIPHRPVSWRKRMFIPRGPGTVLAGMKATLLKSNLRESGQRGLSRGRNHYGCATAMQEYSFRQRADEKPARSANQRF